MAPPSTDELMNRGDAPPRSYPVRWHVLAIYMLLGFTNQSIWLSLSPVSAGAALRYDVSEDLITVLVTSSTAAFLPGAWLCSRVLVTRDLRSAVLLGGALQVAGALLRWFADLLLRPLSPRLAFAVLFLGQDLAALAAPAFMNTPAVLAGDWFEPQERELAMAAAIFSPIVGQGAGGAVAGVVAGGSKAEGFAWVLGGQAVACAVTGLWAMLRFRAKPPTPPLQSAQEADAGPILATWARLLCRPQFLLVLAIFSAGMALAAAILTLFGQLSRGCGYGPGLAGLAQILYMLCGVAGSLASGYIMGRTRAYRTCLRSTVAAACIAGVAFLLTLRPGGAAGLLVSTAAFGMLLLSCLPTLITNAVEETYPTPADACTSLLFISSVVVQIFVTPALQAVHDAEASPCGGIFAPSRLFIIALAAFGCLLPALAYRGLCHRKDAEQQQQQRSERATQISVTS